MAPPAWTAHRAWPSCDLYLFVVLRPLLQGNERTIEGPPVTKVLWLRAYTNLPLLLLFLKFILFIYLFLSFSRATPKVYEVRKLGV